MLCEVNVLGRPALGPHYSHCAVVHVALGSALLRPDSHQLEITVRKVIGWCAYGKLEVTRQLTNSCAKPIAAPYNPRQPQKRNSRVATPDCEALSCSCVVLSSTPRGSGPIIAVRLQAPDRLLCDAMFKSREARAATML